MHFLPAVEGGSASFIPFSVHFPLLAHPAVTHHRQVAECSGLHLVTVLLYELPKCQPWQGALGGDCLPLSASIPVFPVQTSPSRAWDVSSNKSKLLYIK